MTRLILCWSCSDTAVEYEGPVDVLEGDVLLCQTCGEAGAVCVDADEFGVYTRFCRVRSGVHRDSLRRSGNRT